MLGAKAATEEAVRAKRITFIVAIMASLGAPLQMLCGCFLVEEQIFEKRPDCDVCMSEIIEMCLKIEVTVVTYLLRYCNSIALHSIGPLRTLLCHNQEEGVLHYECVQLYIVSYAHQYTYYIVIWGTYKLIAVSFILVLYFLNLSLL